MATAYPGARAAAAFPVAAVPRLRELLRRLRDERRAVPESDRLPAPPAAPVCAGRRRARQGLREMLRGRAVLFFHPPPVDRDAGLRAIGVDRSGPRSSRASRCSPRTRTSSGRAPTTSRRAAAGGPRRRRPRPPSRCRPLLDTELNFFRSAPLMLFGPVANRALVRSRARAWRPDSNLRCRKVCLAAGLCVWPCMAGAHCWHNCCMQACEATDESRATRACIDSATNRSPA